MRTEELIAVLARDNPRVDPRVPARRFAWAVAFGLAAAGLCIALLLGVRPDLAAAMRLPAFWWKLAFALGVAGGAAITTQRLARPGRQVGLAWLSLALPVLAAITTAAAVLLAAPRDSWGTLVRGNTWLVCPLLIALLSIPAFAVVFRALRQMAPVQPGLAGASGGLLAGALATIAYCLHCPEMEVPFWATWYTLGMLIPAIAGGLLGPRLLRW